MSFALERVAAIAERLPRYAGVPLVADPALGWNEVYLVARYQDGSTVAAVEDEFGLRAATERPITPAMLDEAWRKMRSEGT